MSAEANRREIFGVIGTAAALIPTAANAAAGESPRFSVFGGLVGDGTAMSEGAAYGTDQSAKVYSPYSVYGVEGENSAYKRGGFEAEFNTRKKATLAETKKRLEKIPAYVSKKEWSNVNAELTRYMYETRTAVRGLAKTVDQKEAADSFFKAIEKTYGSATLKKGDECLTAAKDSVAKLDKFSSLI